MTTMRAMQIDAPGHPLRMIERPLPTPGRHEVLLEVRACGVCRTDLHVADRDIPARYPVIPGHEIVGLVLAFGGEVTDFTLGERVGVPWLGATCGVCPYCRHGQENLCDSPEFTGCTRDGGYATHVVADARFCFPLPDRFTDVEAAPLLCAGLIGWRALRMAGDGGRIGLYGFGAAAHILAQVAIGQQREVYAFTKRGDAKGQAFARSLGCVWAGASDEPPPVPLDAALIFAPVGALVPLALRAVHKGGRVVCAGIHMSDIPAFPYDILWGERQILSVANLTREDGSSFFAIASGSSLKTVTTPFPLERANEALAAVRDGSIEGAAVIVPGDARQAGEGGVAQPQDLDRGLIAVAMAPAVANSEEEDQAGVVAFLQGQTAHSGAGAVRLLDTHAASLFLAGDRAWKMKRAVRFGYLDFSTLDRRRAALEAELRLNRRTAPDLYRAVLPVTRDETGALAIGGGGQVVEWLLEMERFPDGALLAEMADRGQLDGRMLARLADRLVAFHAAAEEIRCNDGTARFRSVIDGNVESMAAFPAILPPDRVEALIAVQRQTLSRVAPLLDERARAGRLRRAHGDLHLANIAMIDGEPTPFDCLEFSEELGSIDLLYDLAFLLMDLWQRGLRTEANIILNRYLDLSPADETALPLLPLFLSVRATIRAHVAAARHERKGDVHTRAETETYLTLAAMFLQPHRPCLVAVGGLSGSGKSTVARALGGWVGVAPGARILRSDVLRKRLVGLAPEIRLPAESYTPEASRRTYDALAELAATALAGGRAVIVDAVFARPEERSAIEALAARVGVSFVGLWLEADRADRVERLSARGPDASDADAIVAGAQAAYTIGPLGAWCRIQAEGAPDEIAAEARAVVAAGCAA